jgi:hypothetical protein
MYSHTLSLPPGNPAGILVQYPRNLTILSLYARARTRARTHTHTNTHKHTHSLTHTYIHSVSCPLLIGSERVREDPNSNRFIDFTFQLVAWVYSFIISLRKGKMIEVKHECKQEFANRIQGKKFASCSYFCIQFGQHKRYFLMGIWTE